MNTILLIEGSVIFLFFFLIFITSCQEKEYRAALIALISGMAFPVPFFIPYIFNFFYPDWMNFALSGLFLLPAVVFLLPFRWPVLYSHQGPPVRFDERDTIFSRRELQPGSSRFREYYERDPGKKALDDAFREKPGLLKAGSKYYDAVLFAAASSLFDKVDTLHPRVEARPAERMIEVDPADISVRITGMLREWGVHSVGITTLRDYHVYAAGGRGDRYGTAYEVEHKYAIAFTVEMDYDMMRMAPAAPAVVESASQYLQSGMIAIQLTEFIRSLGYEARAHIDANYKVICPLVARDAGLGEIGRMGLLMTPGLGPRVRIAVVTTDMPLLTDKVKPDPSVADFCRHCRKCADVCPGRSIPFGPEEVTGGVARWQINSESCYTWWCIAGTDCGRCMTVCPYAHLDASFHRLIRFGNRHSVIFRRIAIVLDDVFYGSIPKPRKR